MLFAGRGARQVQIHRAALPRLGWDVLDVDIWGAARAGQPLSRMLRWLLFCGGGFGAVLCMSVGLPTVVDIHSINACAWDRTLL